MLLKPTKMTFLCPIAQIISQAMNRLLCQGSGPPYLRTSVCRIKVTITLLLGTP
jgi:hypothetical protein